MTGTVVKWSRSRQIIPLSTKYSSPKQGRIQDLIGGGGAQIVTGLKLPFWGLSFVEFWCWGLIFGCQGGPSPPPDPPLQNVN